MELLIENIEKQLIEIEILKTIYPNPNEFAIEDEYALYEANEFVADKSADKIPQHAISFIIKFHANSEENDNENHGEENASETTQIPVEIVCRLPREYPLQSQPEILVRCSSKDSLSRKFYETLNKHIQETHDADCSILSIIDWIKDNLFKYLASDKNLNTERTDTNSQVFSRTWVYFHHIYSTDKRQSLVKWAREFDFTGFLMPGKPGILCVEGSEDNVHEYLTRVRKIPWQKVQVKDIEVIKSNNFSEVRRFQNFEEKFFVNDSSQTHDLGLLFNFLKEKNLSNIFSLYFGVDGKSSSMGNKND